MFRISDLCAILLYLAAMAGIGFYFGKKNKSTEEYFLGNRAFPGWAVGLSMLGTSISSVTFLALPAAAYVLDYRQAVNSFAMPFAALLAVWLFIPFFRRGRATSAFEYLEARYGPFFRAYAAFCFVITQFIRLATVLYLVALPVAGMTGGSLTTVIVVCGFFIALYTVIGGIEAVIWTDVIQTVILLLGGILCMGLMLYELPEGLSDVLRIGLADDKFSFGPVTWGLNDRTFTVLLLLGVVSYTTDYSSNQNVVQRYIAAKSLREARKAVVLSAAMSIPTWMCFFFLGSCLYAFYKLVPDAAVANLAADEVLPHFILTRTPPFLGGVIIAACLAAAMSSLDSSINSISTVCSVDFVKRYGRERSDASLLKIAKIIAVVCGMFMIGGAAALVHIPKECVNDFCLIIASMVGGGKLAIFLLGFFTTRVSGRALLAGLIPAILFNLYLACNTLGWVPEALRMPIHAYWTGILVNAGLALVAYLASFRFPCRRNLTGLTVWTQQKK